MNLSVLEIISLGRKYMQLWPQQSELASYFDEYRAVQVCRLVCRTLPGLAIFIFIMQLYLGSIALLPQALVYSIFMLSLPVQGLVILGVKADKLLPPSLASWYKESVAKVNESGGDVKLSVQKPKYLDLAKLLNISYKSASWKVSKK